VSSLGRRVVHTARRNAALTARRLGWRPADERHDGSAPYLVAFPPAPPTDPPGPTVSLLNDTRDQCNFGSEVLTDGLVRILRDRVPGVTVEPIPSHWMIGLDMPVIYHDHARGFRVPDARYPRVADQFDAVADHWEAGTGGAGVAAIVERLGRADLVFTNGEGSLYRDNESAVRELFCAWFAKERLGIPTVFANAMVHLTDVVPILPGMVRRTFPVLDAVAVREARSLANLEAFLPDLPARLIPDSAFAITPADARDTAAVADVRARIGGRPYFVFDPGTMPIDARPGTRSALHRMIEALKGTDVQAVFVRKDLTDQFVEAVARETGSVFVDTVEDYREYMTLLADAEYVVTGRYHNTTLAGIMGCPVLALATTNHKVHGAVDMLDPELGEPFDGTDVLPALDAIVARARGFRAERDAWRRRLTEVAAVRHQECFALGDLVRDRLVPTR
jgi:polysaccharide pyruvyl transferase WcaK-like protein